LAPETFEGGRGEKMAEESEWVVMPPPLPPLMPKSLYKMLFPEEAAKSTQLKPTTELETPTEKIIRTGIGRFICQNVKMGQRSRRG